MNLKRALLIGLLALIPSGVWAAITERYVDGGCPTTGDGTTATCGGSGPFKTIDECVAVLTSDIRCRVKGVHAKHGTETADFDGRYFFDVSFITSKNGSSGHPAILQAEGWTASGAGTQEAVYIDGVGSPGTWTQCLSGTSGPCTGVPSPVNEVWYINAGSTMDKSSGAIRPDGQTTRHLANLGCLTTKFDSYSDHTSGGNLFVRWGTGADAPLGVNNPKPYVLHDNNGTGFYVNGSSWITIQGFIFRAHHESAIIVANSSANIVINDNQILYDSGWGGGDDYGIAIYNSTPVTISNNEIGYTGSEGIHSDARTSGATVYTISGNWIHDIGDKTVLGPGDSGTPSGMIISSSSSASTSGAGDYTGTVVDGNFLSNIGTNKPSTSHSSGSGILIENNSHGATYSNNVMYRTGGPCFNEDGNGTTSGGSVGSNTLMNNVLVQCGQTQTGDQAAAILVQSSTSTANANSNTIAHNTIVEPVGPGLAQVLIGSGTATGNIFQANIVSKTSGTSLLVNWPNGIPTMGWNDLYYSGTGNILNLGGNSQTCFDLNHACLTCQAADQCLTPGFRNEAAHDYRLDPSSDLIDAGPTAAQEAYRTVAMTNAVANAKLSSVFPRMDEGCARAGRLWDRGAFETRLPYPGIESPGNTDFLNVNFGWASQAEGGCILTVQGHAASPTRHGLSSLQLQGRSTGPTCGSLSYTMSNLDTARTYTVLGYYQASGTLGTATTDIEVQIDGSTICHIAPSADVTSWALFPNASDPNIVGTCTFTPAGTTAEIKLLKEEQASGTTNFWFDDLEVIVTN